VRLHARVTSVQKLENFVMEIWADSLQQLPDNCRHPFLASTAADMGHTQQLIREDMWPHS